MLTERPEQLKDKAELSKRSLRWFAGNAPDNRAIHLVAEMHGNDIFQLWGRLGKPCPNDQPCGPTPSSLPGEGRDVKGTAITTGKRVGEFLRQRTGAGGKGGAKVTQEVVADATAADRSGLLGSDR